MQPFYLFFTDYVKQDLCSLKSWQDNIPELALVPQVLHATEPLL